jgi:uncharacterized protein (TIGR03437 family)
MRHARISTSFALLFLACTGFAAAQVTIGAVVNAGSRLPSGSPFFGIAQGSLFAITGKGVGPDELQQASFPLPTVDGLGGVTVQATVGGATVDCIMVYVSATEVAAILPSNTPLGAGAVTLNNNGVTASKPITVVAAAFGIFTTRQGFGAGPAVAFGVSAEDGSVRPISQEKSVQPAQDVMISGTGLGAIPSDETQSGVTDVPNTAIQVYVGVKPAAVVSAGRSVCCDGLDPTFRIPPGIAAWDVIRFTVPEGVTGCFVPVVVQIGGFVSNLATIPVAAGGGACIPAVSTVPPEVTSQLAGKTGVSIAAINLGRGTGISVRPTGAIVENKRDTGDAVFVRYPNLPASMFAAEYFYPVNVCSINGYPGPNGGVNVNGTEVAIVPQRSVSLDAGPTIAVSGPSGTRSIVRRMAGMVVDYSSATFGDTTPKNYFDPGHYTVTGPGGRDVGAFTASIDVPSTPFVWTNMPSPTAPIDRSKDLTVSWTGGIPNTQVTVLGAGFGSGITSAFLCAAPVSAGQITIPAYVLMSLPPTGNSIVPGQLSVQNRLVNTFAIPSVDIASIAFGAGFTLSTKYE